MNNSAPVPAGIDLQGVSAFLARHVPGGEGPLAVELLSGGRSNITYALTTPHGSWVLRRPPLGHVLPTAHDMAREFRVLSALTGSGVPVPRPLAFCDDPDVTGAPFYVMERRHGVIAHEALPPGYAEQAEERRAISLALVNVVARLHAVDWRAVGLEGFGRPEGFMARQVRRWGEQWERSKTRDLPDFDRLRDRLAATVPESPPPSIVHGDLRLGNMILDPHDPGRVVALLDWEMSTIGDPLADFGWAVACWVHHDDPPVYHAALHPNLPMAVPGFLRRDELIATYAEATGSDVSNIGFYLAFSLLKLAAIIEGIHARHLKGETVGEGFELYGVQVPEIVQIGVETLAWAGLA